MRPFITPPRPRVQPIPEETRRQQRELREIGERKREQMGRPEFIPEPDHDATVVAVPRPMLPGWRV